MKGKSAQIDNEQPTTKRSRSGDARKQNVWTSNAPDLETNEHVEMEPTQTNQFDFGSEDFMSYRNEEPYSGQMTMKTEVAVNDNRP